MATRGRIVEAYVSCIEEFSADSVTVTLIAERANVATKTIYRHFPTRADLLSALSEWSLDNFVHLVELEHISDLPAVFRAVTAQFERRPRLTRALASSDLGREVLSGVSLAVATLIENAIDRDFPHLNLAQRMRLKAGLTFLDSPQAWSHLHDNFQLNAEQVADTVEWAIHALVRSAEDPVAASPHKAPDSATTD